MAFYLPPQDLENNQPLLQPTTHNPLPEPEPGPEPKKHGKSVKVLVTTLASILIMVSLMGFIYSSKGNNAATPRRRTVVSRGKKEGVSEKAFRGGEIVTTPELSFAWTKDMLKWQRTGYHLQSPKNLMSDPDGPLYYKGYYHLFYQHNPSAPVWGNISWGHAVSKDLIHWEHLPIAIKPEEWYDIDAAMSGSTTILPDGNIVMLYTGSTKDKVQVICLAYPANISDPLLIEWVKYPGNPILTPPEGIKFDDYRDPTTGWLEPDGFWRIMIGSKKGRSGISLIYKTRDFRNYELEGNLHAVHGTGMWECVDFFPMSIKNRNGLDMSEYGPGLKHFLKASMDDYRHDDYALGTYNRTTHTWTPDNPNIDLGTKLRVDYGRFYASRSFYDPVKKRRVLWGMAPETDTEADDMLKGWATMQTIPRVITYDDKTGTHVLQQPVEELESLRKDYIGYDDIILNPGSIINLNITSASQLDVSVEFVIDKEALKSTLRDDVVYNCNPSSVRQALGPFGLLVLADESLSELTPIYFTTAKASDGTLEKWFCADHSRSSKAIGVDDGVHGGPVPILEGENYHMRVLVDHSVVEAFGQGGRTCVTSRLYPTRAVNEKTRIFLFNNGTSTVRASINIWEMDYA